MVALVEFEVAFYGKTEHSPPSRMFINANMAGLISAEGQTEQQIKDKVPPKCQIMLQQNPLGIEYVIVLGTLAEVANKLAAGDAIVPIDQEKEVLEGTEPGEIPEGDTSTEQPDSQTLPTVKGADVKPTAADSDPGVAGKDLAQAGTAKPTPKAEPSKG